MVVMNHVVAIDVSQDSYHNQSIPGSELVYYLKT